MALTEQVVLDIQSAQRQINALETQLQGLSTPVDVPVQITGENQLEQIRRELGLSDDAAERLNRELSETDAELRQAGTQARRTGDDIESAGRRGGTAFAGLRGSVIGLVGAFGAIQGARAFLDFAGQAINSASELEQSIGALDAVFGELGSEVAQFGEVADQSVGLAASQFNQLASLLGSQLLTFGFNVADAADETQRLIGLSADLAATFGGPVSDAVEAISSLLRGEVNPIERYGVAMNQALVNAKALELGLANTTAELSLQDTTMARLAILTEQTARNQGQFARESETTAGRLERIRADFENFQADVGGALVPAFEAVLDLIPGIVDALENTLIPALAGVGTAIEGVETTGFLTFLAGLPSGIQTAGSQFSSGAQALGNAFDVLGSIAMLDFGDVGEQFRQLGEDIQDFRGAGAANEAIQTLIQTLATGREPVAALESTLVDLGENVSSLTLDQFDPLARQLVTMATAAGASAPELRTLAEQVLEFGTAAGFSEAGVAILAETLLGPWGQAMAQASAGDIIAENLASSLGAAGDAAQGAAGPLGDLPDDFGQIADESQRAADSLRAAGDALLALTNPAFAAVDAQGGLSDAQKDLAEAVEEFGSGSPEAIQAAIDLAEAEIRLRDAAADLPDGLEAASGAITDMIDDGQVATTTLEGVQELLDELNGTITQAQLDILINTFGSTTGGAFAVGPGFDGTNRGAGSGGAESGNGNTVNVNYYTEPAPTNDTQRALQQIAAVVN